MKRSSRDYYIAFNMIQGIGGRRMLALEKQFGTLDKAWHASYKELLATPGLGEKTVQSVCTQRRKVCPVKEMEWAKKHGGRILTLADSDYPEILRTLAVPPPTIYVIGTIPDQAGIAVVGTRRPSQSGVMQARYFSSEIAKRGVPVISGLARGIDRHAHEGALAVDGVTVGVLGSNIGAIYPSEHRALAGRIGQQGAVVSEFSSRCPTVPGNFLRRNRIISGLSCGVLVVQAGLKSGALNTADWALDQGKDVWAVPGEISDPLRQGTHYLIKQGAGLVSHVNDILPPSGDHNQNSDPLSEQIAALYSAGCHINEISTQLRLPIQKVLAEISRMQVDGTLKL